jgi:hypothetical protein
MRNILATAEEAAKASFEKTPIARRRSLGDLLGPLDQIAANSSSLVANHGASFEVGGESYEIPRYLFLGPKGGEVPIRLGLFAAIHGDEPEGAHGLIHFVKLLEARPELATGYCLSIYPVCNPTGFEDSTGDSRAGKDLNREFWKNSTAPEVRILQAELASHSFDGIISLHTHASDDGFYGIVRSATLTRHLVEPALRAAEIFLPREEHAFIKGLPAWHGVVRDDTQGVLSAPPNVRPHPFEITLETPKAPPSYLKEFAICIALRTILAEYHKLISYARNI